MKQLAVFFALALLVISRVATAAQDSAATQTAGGTAVVIPIEIDTPTEATFGYIQATIAPGGSYSVTAGSAPKVQFVSAGTLSVQSDDVTVVTADPATPEVLSGDHVLPAGTAFVVSAGGSAELSNESADPAVVFDLLTASDAAITNESDVNHVVLARQTYELPAGPVTITLAQTALDPGEQFAWPAEPAVTMLYPLDRADAFVLTGQGFNKGKDPIEIYALTIEPA